MKTKIKTLEQKEKHRANLEYILQNTELQCRYIGDNIAYLEGKNPDSQIDASDLRDLADAGYNIRYIDITRDKLNICVYLADN